MSEPNRLVSDSEEQRVRAMVTGRCGVATLGTAAMLLAGCGGGGGGGGGGDATDEITASVNTFVRDRDCSVITPGFRNALTGERDASACSHSLAERNKVKSLHIGTVTHAGNTGTAAVTTDGTTVHLTLVKQDGAWLVSGDLSDAAKTSPGTTGPTTTATLPASDGRRAAKLAYLAAVEPYHAARKRFSKRALADIKARDFPAVQGDFRKYRDAVYAFDGKLRRIGFPAGAQAAAVGVLEANRIEIADLDAVGDAADFTALYHLLRDRYQPDDIARNKALSALAKKL
jgi:hypothetical protein